MKKLVAFFLLVVCFSAQAYDSQDFSVWLEQFKAEAKAEHISAKTIKATFKKAKYLPQVIVQDRAQPEFISPFLIYIENRVTHD